MHQERICHWLGRRTCTHNRTFLDLPAPIRRRIYDYAGLFSGKSIYVHSLKQHHEDLDGENHNKKIFESDPCDWCDTLHFTFRLLQTCKAVYAEVSAVVYSENVFLVPYRAVDDGLRILGNITPHACNKLTNLFVHLSRVGYCPGNYILDDIKIEPIRKSRVAAWQKAAKHILTYSNPQKLSLYFICNVYPQMRIVPDVLAPFHDFPGSLKDCALRLNYSKDNHSKDDLYYMARQAAIIVSDKPTHLDQPFRFLDLPQDLQQSILKYTDLITPTNEVRWNPQRGFYYKFPREELSAEYYDRRVFQYCADYHFELGCFCMRDHCVYSSRCRCWRPPQALFLVSRAMCESSRAVFYSYNRIIIIPLVGIWKGRSPLLAGLETFIFITKFLKPDTLSYLRYLELVCPPFQTHDPLTSSDPVPYVHWQSIIDSLRTHANLPALTIAVYMTRFEPPIYSIGNDSRQRVTDKAFEEGNFTMDSDQDLTLRPYLDILLPFRSLTRMGRFFEINCRLSEVEMCLEQKVMGSGYDSRALGKADIKLSQWLQAVRSYFRDSH
ncbi:uncharacterized protein F4817DRAFT_356133 [Daldinia loculata]|uniref:uncharacterized protein n=1 Tax=Daldinia loculata TaxID=103429 RepID=UPI0020C3E24E|nr:uncharacterized protein F4817DRAFT_356133 [Daldinia loculata]KAI1651127.1 hypothetical protein F4817DRAFT_356133 [Daldinia loculata]